MWVHVFTPTPNCKGIMATVITQSTVECVVIVRNEEQELMVPFK